MLVFYFFAALLLWQGLASLRGGFRFRSYVRRELGRPRADFSPFASMIVPFRGVEQGLADNLAALFEQDYPAYELIFVTDSSSDPALPIIRELERRDDRRDARQVRIVIAGAASESGQKVHNLRAAVRELSVQSEVLVFVDTDARPRADWLRSLVAPLGDEQTGAATGYRWFLPNRGGLASHLCSVWNASIASALGERGERNFCWGGSTAIRRETFERLAVAERWKGTLSDDFALMRMLREARLPVYFVPRCLTPSVVDCSFGELLEFTTRQIKITRVYAPNLWLAVLLGNALFVSVFYGGIILVVTRALTGRSFLLPLSIVLAIFALGLGKASLRVQAVSLPLSGHHAKLRKGIPAHLLLWPLTAVLYLYNALAAAFSRRIEWRGIAYELKSPAETVIIHQTGVS